jgi:hypothetical protein
MGERVLHERLRIEGPTVTRDAINWLETQPGSLLNDPDGVVEALKGAGFPAEAAEVEKMSTDEYQHFVTEVVC